MCLYVQCYSLVCCTAGDATDLCLMRGEHEMQLCLSAEGADSLTKALSHVNKAIGMYSTTSIAMILMYIF